VTTHETVPTQAGAVRASSAGLILQEVTSDGRSHQAPGVGAAQFA